MLADDEASLEDKCKFVASSSPITENLTGVNLLLGQSGEHCKTILLLQL